MRLAFLGAVAAALTATAFAAEKTVAPKITDIRAQLFYETKGSLSDNILAQKDLSLWNTIIGEGSAGGSSTSTLVTVEVSGQHVGLGDVQVEVIATNAKKKVVGKATMDVSLYDAKTTFYAPLFLANTGCDEIKIVARLKGKGAPKGAVTKTIPFACGE
jgi:hypothetical protein